MKWACLFVVLLVSPLHAQIIGVRSGEHGDFTRLVFYNSSRQPPQVRDHGANYELNYGAGIEGYDLSNVYKRIDRKRIKGLRVKPNGSLLVDFDCECHAAYFEHSAGVFVFDIKDSLPKDGLPDVPPKVAYNHFTSLRAAKPSGDAIAADVSLTKHSIMKGTHLRDSSLNTLLTSEFQLENVEQFTTSYGKVEKENTFDTNGFKTSLIESLAGAASSGAIKISPPPARTSTNTPQDHGIDSPAVRPTNTNLESLSVEGNACPNKDIVNVAAWGGDEDPTTRIAEAKLALLSEFDQPNSPAVMRALQTYLFYGFGAEARDLMNTFSIPKDVATYAIPLSYIVENTDAKTTAFLNLHTCEGPTALWAMLEAQEGVPLVGLNSKAVVRHFLALPRNLKQYLAGPVAAKLIAHGHREEAEIVRRSLTRILPRGAPEVALIKTNISAEAGRWSQASQTLDQNPAARSTLEGVLALSEANFQQKKPLRSEELTFLESAYFQYFNGPEREKIAHALARSRALADDYVAAFDVASHNQVAVNDVWFLLATLAGDSALINHVSELSQSKISEIPPDIRVKLAERLVDLGVPQLAKDIIANTDIPPDLLLKISLSGHDEATIIQQLEAGTIKNDGLKAEAFAQLGQFSRLKTHYAEIGNTEQSERVGRWLDKLPAQNAGAWPVNAEEQKVSLSHLREILSASKDIRTDFERIVGEP